MAVELTQQNLQIFFTGLHLKYDEGYRMTTPWWSQIAMTMPSSTELETYAWMDRLPKMRQWLGPRVKNNVPIRSRSITNIDWELTEAIPRNKFADDKLGLYSKVAEMMGWQASKLPDQQLVSLLQSNPVGFDGLTFFNTAHPSNLDDATVGTYNNALTLPLTPANLGAARASMRAYNGADAQPFGSNPNLLIVPPQLEDVARRIINATMIGRLAIGTTTDAGAATEDNIYANAGIQLLVIPELANQPTTWYLVDNTTPIRPFVVQMRQAPNFVYLTNPTDANLFWNKELVFGVDARMAFDVSLPWLAVRSVG